LPGRRPPPWLLCGVVWYLAALLPELQASACPAWGQGERVQAGGADLIVPGYSVPSFADWNNDGLKDLIVGEGGGGHIGKVRVYLNNGLPDCPHFDGYFHVQAGGADLTESPGFCFGTFPRTVFWDADSRKDLLVGLAGGEIKIYLNTATDDAPSFDGGTYLQAGPVGAKTNINVGLRATATVADWNADGKKDLVVGAYDGRIHLFINDNLDSAPSFLTETFAKNNGNDLTVIDVRSSPHFFDLDADGRPDLLSGNTEGELVIYRNIGTAAEPNFSGYAFVKADGVVINLPLDARSRPFVCDWQGDGVPDILAGSGDGAVYLFRGLPKGDIDGDEDVDLADAAALVAVLVGENLEPGCCERSDLNADGLINGEDIGPLVAALLSP
jgi:large repetitive protein